MARRLNDLTSMSYATIYGDLNATFHVGKYSDIPEASWQEVTAWFSARITASERRRR
jgi:hypothetical protein